MNTSTPPERNEHRHPIQVVARRTGLSVDVIRAWERRYQAVVPERSGTARRLYSDAETHRLHLLRRAVDTGRRIGDVVALDDDGLRALVEEDGSLGHAVGPGEHASVDEHLGACQAAVEQLDPAALDLAIARASVALSMPVLLAEVFGPLLRRVGDSWRAGHLRAAHEHLASAHVRAYLAARLGAEKSTPQAPELVVTTPAGQVHEIGALMVAVTAACAGWRPSYFGPSMPAEEIAFAATRRGAAAVAISICYPADDPGLPSELGRLRRGLPPDTALLVGGAACGAYREALDAIGAEQMGSLLDLHLALDRLRSRSAPPRPRDAG